VRDHGNLVKTVVATANSAWWAHPACTPHKTMLPRSTPGA
jgi:hypothetical protein